MDREPSNSTAKQDRPEKTSASKPKRLSTGDGIATFAWLAFAAAWIYMISIWFREEPDPCIAAENCSDETILIYVLFTFGPAVFGVARALSASSRD